MTEVVERWLPLPDSRLVAAAGFGLLGIGLGYQTTVGPALVIAAMLGLAIVTVSFVSLPLGLSILTFLTFFELVRGFGSGNLTLVKLVGLLITFSWLARVIDTRSGIRLLFVEHRLFAVMVATFFVWAAASVGWAQNADAVTGTATRLLFVIILTFVAFSAVQEPKHLRWVLWAYCTGAF